MGPQDCGVLHAYWGRLHMISCQGVYYEGSFQFFWSGTQGYRLSPTIINLAVDVVLRHLVTMVAGGAGGQNG